MDGNRCELLSITHKWGPIAGVAGRESAVIPCSAPIRELGDGWGGRRKG